MRNRSKKQINFAF